MKKLSGFILVIVILLSSNLWLKANDSDLIPYLRDRDWSVRKNTADMLGSMRSKIAVKALIDTLQDETNNDVLTAVHNSLMRITSQNLPAEYDKWLKWWEEIGSKQFEPISPVGNDTSQTAAFIVIGISLLLLLLFIMIFSYIGGSKIKEVKEIIKKAERYTTDADGVTQRFNNLIEEIERRRSDAVDFFHKIKDENTAEIERFSDLLQENLEHKMREVTMSLREKAEAELKDTVNQIRQDIEREVKRFVMEYKERLDHDVEGDKARFGAEVETYIIFIEGSFYLANGRYKEALRHYKKVLEFKPDYYHAWNNNGTALRQLNRYDEALESYHKALELAPDNPIVFYNLAATYALMRKKDKMLENLKRTFQSDSTLKDEALNDQSFKGYWSDKDFKDIAEA
jgi:tetratricopeptide (TPR) repeat protein